MQFTALVLAFCAMLAGRVYALNITFPFNGQPNITASQLLTFSDNDLITKCQTNCSNAIADFKTCGDFNNTCLCQTSVVADIASCEQCFFSQLIAENRKMPDPRAGNSAILAGYVAGCANDANVTVKAALHVPSDFDGPFEQLLNTGATAFTVIVALVLGVGAITIVNTM